MYARKLVQQAFRRVLPASIVGALRCRWHLWTAGDFRWSSRLAADPEFRRGVEYFRALRISKVRTVVDIGANEGQFLLPALKYLSPERALAVEMLPDLARRLTSRLPRSVRVYACAAGGGRGRAPSLRSTFSPASSLLELFPEASSLYGRDLEQSDVGAVDIRTLDDLCMDAGMDSIDLLKIDVQGYELEVLRGARRILKRTRQIIIEVEFVPIYQGGPLFPAVWQDLESHGFVLSQLFAQCQSSDGVLLHADALFTAKALAGQDSWTS
jgi:FkbM family methyltransferase